MKRSCTESGLLGVSIYLLSYSSSFTCPLRTLSKEILGSPFPIQPQCKRYLKHDLNAIHQLICRQCFDRIPHVYHTTMYGSSRLARSRCTWCRQHVSLISIRVTTLNLSFYSGTYFFFGGMLMLLGGIGEFFLGNAFPTVVFLSFSKSIPHKDSACQDYVLKLLKAPSSRHWVRRSSHGSMLTVHMILRTQLPEKCNLHFLRPLVSFW